MKKTTTCTLSVSGMHCGSCEVLLEKKISKMKGIAAVRASLSDKTITITHTKGHPPRIETLNTAFEELGYSFTPEPIGEGTLTKDSLLQALIFGIVFIIAYIILQDSQILARVNLDGRSSILAFFGLGVIASLSSCAALVGGLLLSLSKEWNALYGGKYERMRMEPFFMFNVGRLFSFALFGGLLGLVGSVFQISLQFTAAMVIAVSLIMILLGLQMLGVGFAKRIRIGYPRFLSRFASDEKNFQGRSMPFVMGAFTFFLPCGFTLMAQTVALATGSFVTSALMMMTFAIGTLPMLAFLSFSSVKLQKHAVFAGTFNLIVGLFIILFGLYNINSQLNVLGVVSLSDFTTRNSSVSASQGLGVSLVGEGENQQQIVTMEAREFEYFPKNLTLKAGIPTILTVNNFDVVGCAQAMWLGGLSDEVLYLNTPKAKTEFIPKAGRYKISCTMGMVPPVIVTVES